MFPWFSPIRPPKQERREISSGEPWKRSWEPTRKFKTGLLKVSFAVRLRDCSHRSCDTQLSCVSSMSSFLLLIISIRFLWKSRKIPKISPGAYMFQRPILGGYFLRSLYSEGLIYGGKLSFQNQLGLYLEGNLRLKIGWANL